MRRENNNHQNDLDEVTRFFSEALALFNEIQSYLAPYEPTPQEALEPIIDTLKKLLREANKRKQPIVYEPGCGKGIAASKIAPQLDAYYLCLEIDKNNVKKAREKCRDSGYLVEVIQGDLASFYARRIDAVYAYLLPVAIELLEKVLEPGTPIVSLDYYGSLEPVEEIELKGGTLYIIRVGEEKNKDSSEERL